MKRTYLSVFSEAWAAGLRCASPEQGGRDAAVTGPIAGVSMLSGGFTLVENNLSPDGFSTRLLYFRHIQWRPGVDTVSFVKSVNR